MYIHNNQNILKNIAQIGKNVTLPNRHRNYCTYDDKKTKELVNAGTEAIPYIKAILDRTTIEEEALDCLQILDKMLDNGVKGIDKLYPTLSRFTDVTSPNVQVMLAGIYRKTLVPDAFGPLNKMLMRQTFMPNSPFFDPTEEIGGAIFEYIRSNAAIKAYNNK